MAPTKMIFIGLTGGVGVGKSTVAAILRQNQIDVIDADQLGHLLYVKGQSGHTLVTTNFGEAVLKNDGSGEIDRAKLRNLVFGNSANREKLEKIIWPLIKQKVVEMGQNLKKENKKIVVTEAALLFEAGWEEIFDRIWLVLSPTEKVLQRGVATGRDEHEIRLMLDNQLCQDQRIKLAEMFDGPVSIILNGADTDALHRDVMLNLNEIL